MAEGEQHFKIIKKRKPNTDDSQTQSGFHLLDRRASTLTPEEIRQKLLQQTLQTLTRETTALPIWFRSVSIGLQTHHQQAPNTCLLACSISVAEAIGRSRNKPTLYNEPQITQQLNQLGLINRFGLNTIDRRVNTIDFLQENLGLSITDTTTREPAEMAQGIIRALLHKDIALINSAAHWVAIYGLRKESQESVQYLVMNPASSTLEEMTTASLANRLVGDPLYSPSGYSGLGVKADLLYVNVPNVNFRINSVRT